MSHIIALHASYHGPLIRGKYQFTFGGNESYSAVTGFSMLHSGQIKKMKLKGPFRQGSIVRPTPHCTIIMKHLMFRIILVGPTGHVTTLSRVQYETVNYKDDIEPLNFRSNCHNVKFVDEWKEKLDSLSEGDIINILTEINLDYEPEVTEYDLSKKVYLKSTYHFAFLIELDPLKMI